LDALEMIRRLDMYIALEELFRKRIVAASYTVPTREKESSGTSSREKFIFPSRSFKTNAEAITDE
jgi:hypothetical protein